MADLQEKVRDLPHSPGVYIYRDGAGDILYVGKAVDLNRRVRQYFDGRDAVGPKTAQLVSKIASLETIDTLSEFEALLLEAKLIRQYQPPFNVLAKDDKSPLYIAITLSEQLPTVGFVRKNVVERGEAAKKDEFFGPFQSGKMARALMRDIRRIVPYCTTKRRDGRKCFYTHIGLCSPCPSYIAKLPEGDERQTLTREYRDHMFRIRDILSGKSRGVAKAIEADMRAAAAAERYEDAARLRDQYDRLNALLERHYDPEVYVKDAAAIEDVVAVESESLAKALARWYPELTAPERIECYDISNIFGEQAVGSMVVLTGGRIDTGEYRRFRIKTVKQSNDVAMMREVLTRRFSKPGWSTPSLVVIDGGKPQVRAAWETLKAMGVTVPVIGLAKRYEEIVVPLPTAFAVVRLPLTSPAIHLLQRIRDEAHRFAITYHRKLRRAASAPTRHA